MTAKQFVKRLKDWRKAKSLSQREAAMVLGLNKRTLQNWECGKSRPEPPTLAGLIHHPALKLKF